MIARMTWVMLFTSAVFLAQAAPKNYLFVVDDRETITQDWFAASTAFDGAQLRYTWKELEPEKGKYNFDSIRADLETLGKSGKKLFIQFQDVSFGEYGPLVPGYVAQEPEYNSGASQQYSFEDESDSNPRPDGWVARRWDPAVQARLYALWEALGREFDGKIEGINLAESSADFGATGKYWPKDFSPQRYREALIENLTALKQAFPKSVVIQYANFMPGEWLPYNDQGHLKAVCAAAAKMGAGIGGPDIKVYKPAQMNHSYALIHDRAKGVPAGIAVQEGNYEEPNPKTGKPVTVADIYAFSKDYLALDYIFWGMQQPYFERDALPFLTALHDDTKAPAIAVQR